jgi:Protein of unknown function (DUF2914)/Tetratricopeptide repeat
MTQQQDARHMLDRAERAATAGDLASADELLRSAARIQEEELGPLHPDLANTLNNLAIVAEKAGRPDDAETFYRRAAAIAAASLPTDHPMVVESRQNLEGFCRERGLPIDAPIVITAARDTDREATKVAPTPGRTSRSLAWVATGAIVLLVAMLLVLRLRSSHDASVPKTEPVAALQPDATPPRIAAPAARPAPIEQAAPPAAAPPLGDRNVAPDKSLAGGITVATSQLCRTFSTGGTWRCDPVGQSVAPGPIVFYTRVRSRRDAAVVHRWYHGDTLRQSVTLNIQANATEGYRTYSRLTVEDGDWRVEVRSADGSLLHEQRFAVR